METNTVEIIEGEQFDDTPAVNIKQYEIDGNTVRAVFWKKEQAVDYIKKYSTFAYSPDWYDQIGFADFSVQENIILAHSTFHPVHILIKMFKDGLKYL